ncbi:MAG: hypothetical protein HGA22_02250 [Clostridiales bacterium]|nr:hypothetical protein [Clostridiales bacterium]
MFLVIGVVVLGIFFFICFVNYSFQKVKFKNRCKGRNYSVFNSPGAWLSYAAVTAVAIALLFAFSLSDMFNGFNSMFNAKAAAESAAEASSSVTETTAATSSDVSGQSGN